MSAFGRRDTVWGRCRETRARAATVLLVEDDPDLREVLGHLLRRQGHRVVTAADGVEAVHRFYAAAPDLVLLELELPRLSGLEVCRAIRGAGRTPILCLSDVADESTRRAARSVGANACLPKPFGVARLVQHLSALLPAHLIPLVRTRGT